MGQEQKASYNKLAGRYGLRAKKECAMEGFPCLLNEGLWESVTQGREKASAYLPDGLHLNEEGRLILVRSWIKAVETVMQ
jgi:hypothetical protein